MSHRSLLNAELRTWKQRRWVRFLQNLAMVAIWWWSLLRCACAPCRAPFWNPVFGTMISVCNPQISNRDLPNFYARELEFRWVTVPVYELHEVWPPSSGTDSKGDSRPTIARDTEVAHAPSTTRITGILCAAYSDEEYKRDRLNNSEKKFHENFGRYGIEKIWRRDLLPCRLYLRHCVLAAGNLAKRFQLPIIYENFLDSTFLGDGKTSMRQYLGDRKQILEEKPPAHLAERYGG